MKCQKDLSPLTTLKIREASPRFNKKIQLNMYFHGKANKNLTLDLCHLPCLAF